MPPRRLDLQAADQFVRERLGGRTYICCSIASVGSAAAAIRAM